MFKSIPPRKGSKQPYWDRVKLEPGKSVCGWCAGPVVWAPTHWEDRSTGCRKEMTGGHLPCQYCAAGFEVRWRGWMPFYDQHGGRMVAVFGDTFQRQADEVGHGDALKVIKTIRQGCPIRVERFAWTTDKCPMLYECPNPVDASELMLRAWKDQALTDWLAAHPDGPPAPPVVPPASDIPLSIEAPGVSIAVRPEVYKAMKENQQKRDQAAHEAAQRTPPTKRRRDKKAPPPANEPAPFGEQFPNLVAKMAGASNGNGKHKKGKK